VKKDFPGTLFLVVGNSGSGKDSIISGVINKYPSNLRKIYLVKRFITRTSSETEKNYSITPEEFKKLELKGSFALKWHIYGLDYGIPIEIEDWLKNGNPVIVNVSRTIINKTREIYANLKVIFIEVPFEITLHRLKKRGRESEELLNERIERAKTHQKLPDADFIVDNSGDLDYAIDQFLNYIVSFEKENQNQ